MSRKILLFILAGAVLVLAGGCVLQENGFLAGTLPGMERSRAEEETANPEVNPAAESGWLEEQLTSGKGGASGQEACKKQLFAMDTYMEFTAYGENREQAVDAAMEEVKELDALLSAGSPSSEISRLNAAGTLTVSEDTAALFKAGAELYRETGGLFDFTIYPVMKLWGFPTKEYRVPEEEEIQAALRLVDASKVVLQEESGLSEPAETSGEGGEKELEIELAEDEAAENSEEELGAEEMSEEKTAEGSEKESGVKEMSEESERGPEEGERGEESGIRVTLAAGQQVDFGGIAKGYTSARVMEIFQEYGITSGLVSLGGNIQTLGVKPDGSRWNIGIRDPEGGQSDYIAVVSVSDCAVVTSGGYERYFEEDGKRYIHIIDPRTGRPVEGDLSSVTIISEDGTLADALSTSLYIMGLDDAVSWWQEHGDNFDFALLTNTGEFYISEGIRENFRTDAVVHVAERAAEP